LRGLSSILARASLCTRALPLRRSARILGLALLGLALRAEAAPDEYQVKGAFLYNFARFVVWPEVPASPAPTEVTGPRASDDPAEAPAIRFCIVGESPFEHGLEQMFAGKRVRGHAIQLVHLSEEEAAHRCALLFVAASEADRIEAHLARVALSPVLTVGDTEGFALRGGMIGFKLEDSRVRFEINLDAVRKAGLSMNARLIQLGDVVGVDPSLAQ